ncbi:hypothetical protein MMC10_008444 [Thelotrema lepadinum]|nr:hypothetical protein [Thelotrema lepadinum]
MARRKRQRVRSQSPDDSANQQLKSLKRLRVEVFVDGGSDETGSLQTVANDIQQMVDHDQRANSTMLGREARDGFDPESFISPVSRPGTGPNDLGAILNKLLFELQQTKDTGKAVWPKYKDLIEEEGEDAIRNKILGCLKSSVVTLFQKHRIDFQSFKQWAQEGDLADKVHNVGIYIHAIYSARDKVIAIYVGQGHDMATRIGPSSKGHLYKRKKYEESKTTSKPTTAQARKQRGKKKNNQSSHIKFWVDHGDEDLWLVFGEFETLPKILSVDEEERVGTLLNIIEMFAALLFRSLPGPTLDLYLPQGADKQLPQMYEDQDWRGLNEACPLHQPLRFKSWRYGPDSRFTGPRHGGSAGIIWREANDAKGDKLRMEIICGGCHNPRTSCFDENPRYAKNNSAYVICRKFRCIFCEYDHYLVPKDHEQPRVWVGTLHQQYMYDQAQENVHLISSLERVLELQWIQLSVWIDYSMEQIGWPPLDLADRGYAPKDRLCKIASCLWEIVHWPSFTESKHRLQQLRSPPPIPEEQRPTFSLPIESEN